MRKHNKRLSLSKETLADLQNVSAALQVGLAPTLNLDCRPTFPQCFQTQAVCAESLIPTDCPIGCTADLTNRCRP